LDRLNKDPKGPFFQKLDENLTKYKEKHYTANRLWRYNWDAVKWRTIDEIIERREDAKPDDSVSKRGPTDVTLINRAQLAERRLKRLRMAKYSQELFDEIVIEFMREKRTILEMCAELDCDEEDITDA